MQHSTRFRPVLTVAITAILLLILLPDTDAAAQATSAKGPEAEGTASSDEPGLWERFLAWRAERIAATDTYLLAVQGPVYAATQDIRMTPLVYRAFGGAIHFEDRTYRPEEVVIAGLSFQFATAGSRVAYDNLRGGATVSYLRRLADPRLAVGGAIDGTGNWRIADDLSNSSFNFDFIASLGPAARWESELAVFGRPGRWHVGASVPVLSYVVREPAFNVSYAPGATQWAPFWTFHRLQLSLGIDRLLNHSEENRLALDYRYDFYRLPDETHPLTVGLHSLTVGYALKTK